MVIDDLNIRDFNKTYVQLPIRAKSWLKCDYCGSLFQRIKKSRERTNLSNNKDSCGNKVCTNEKKKESCLKLYGTPYYFQSDRFIEQANETNLTRYGVTNPSSLDEFKEKGKATYRAKHGVDYRLQNKDINYQHQQYMLSLYADPDRSKVMLNKREQTCLERYGCAFGMQAEFAKQKRNETSLERYGAISYSQTDEYWERRKKTCLDRYEVEHPFQNKDIYEKFQNTLEDRYGVRNYSKSAEGKEKYKQTCMDRYGVPNPLCLPENRTDRAANFGKTENEIREWLNSMGYQFQTTYNLVDGQEVDMYDEQTGLAIEYCGLYWHSEIASGNRTKDYHFNKYKACSRKSVRLMTLFEDEWTHHNIQCRNIIKSALGQYDKTYYARKCLIVELTPKEAGQFYKQHHLQGKAQHTKIAFGLVYENELMAAMSFGRHHRFADRVILDRLCYKSNVRIIGGSKRLFQHCVAATNDVDQIISWSDNRWSNGAVYEHLGFKLADELPPDYSYIDFSKPKMRYSKQSQKKSNTGCPKDVTEREWAMEHGLARIWDCGKKRWVFNVIR